MLNRGLEERVLSGSEFEFPSRVESLRASEQQLVHLELAIELLIPILMLAKLMCFERQVFRSVHV